MSTRPTLPADAAPLGSLYGWDPVGVCVRWALGAQGAGIVLVSGNGTSKRQRRFTSVDALLAWLDQEQAGGVHWLRADLIAAGGPQAATLERLRAWQQRVVAPPPLGGAQIFG